MSTGPLLALGSAFVWGASDFLGGLATKRASAVLVVLISQAVGLVAATAAVLVLGEPWVVQVLGWGALAGASGSAGLIAFYAALSTGRMGVVAPIAALGVLVPVTIGIAAGDRPQPTQLVGVVLAVIGVLLASGPELSGQAGRRPLLLAAVSAVCFGFALVGLHGGSAHSPLLTLVVMRVISVLGLGLLVAIRRPGPVPAGRALGYTVVVGLGDVTANLLFGLASQSGMLSLTSVLGSLYPVATVLLAAVVLRERLGTIEYVGVAAALAGVVLIAG